MNVTNAPKTTSPSRPTTAAPTTAAPSTAAPTTAVPTTAATTTAAASTTTPLEPSLQSFLHQLASPLRALVRVADAALPDDIGKAFDYDAVTDGPDAAGRSTLARVGQLVTAATGVKEVPHLSLEGIGRAVRSAVTPAATPATPNDKPSRGLAND